MTVALITTIAAAAAVVIAVSVLATRGLGAAAEHRSLLELELEAAQLRVAELEADRDASGFRALLEHTVQASVKEGGVIEGTLVAVYEDAFVLRHPVFLAGERPAGIGDEVTIARASAPVVTRRFERGGES